MPTEQALDVVDQLQGLGVKAILLSGGGDPSCHPGLRKVMQRIGEDGMEAGLITNGQKLSRPDIETIVDTCTFIRISLDADSAETHARTHGTSNPHAYPTIMRNVDALVARKAEVESDMTLGFSYLFDVHSAGNLYDAAKRARDQGVNYIRLKPFFTRNKGNDFVQLHKMGNDQAGAVILDELHRAKADLETDKFAVSFPTDRVEYQLSSNGDAESRRRQATTCYVPHFFLTIVPDGHVYPCCIIKDAKSGKYSMGNINDKTLREIWDSEQRRKIHERIDFTDCPDPCQFNHHVEALYQIGAPGTSKRHGNFL
jgi:radical SAM protein with 4Fe4S-binding SPASM domain